MKTFIRTSDEETFKKLVKEGLTFVGKEDNFWTFINDGNYKFDVKEMKIHYTDKLFI